MVVDKQKVLQYNKYKQNFQRSSQKRGSHVGALHNMLAPYKHMLQDVDNAVFWQNVLLYFENDPLSPSF